MKKLVLFFIVLLVSFSIFSQTPSAQVEEYLGWSRAHDTKPKGKITFRFTDASYPRENGKGEKNWIELLGEVQAKGKLLKILQKDGIVLTAAEIAARDKTAARAERKTKKSTTTNPTVVAQNTTTPLGYDPVRPRPLFEDTTQRNSGFSIPDSATVAKNMEQAKQSVTGWRAKLWQSVQPIWEFIMWLFNSIIVFLICLGGLFRYVAKTSANESSINKKGKTITGGWIRDAHQNSSGCLLIVTWIIAIFLLIDAFMWLVYLDLPIWLLIVIWFPLLWFAEKLTGWIVPNLRGDDT